VDYGKQKGVSDVSITTERRIKFRFSLYLRFSDKCFIFKMVSALAEKNPGLASFVFNMFSALAF